MKTKDTLAMLNLNRMVAYHYWKSEGEPFWATLLEELKHTFECIFTNKHDVRN